MCSTLAIHTRRAKQLLDCLLAFCFSDCFREVLGEEQAFHLFWLNRFRCALRRCSGVFTLQFTLGVYYSFVFILQRILWGAGWGGRRTYALNYLLTQVQPTKMMLTASRAFLEASIW